MPLGLASTIARVLPTLSIVTMTGCVQAPPDDLADGERPQLLVNPDFEDGMGGPALWGYEPPLGWVAVGGIAIESSLDNIFEGRRAARWQPWWRAEPWSRWSTCRQTRPACGCAVSTASSRTT